MTFLTTPRVAVMPYRHRIGLFSGQTPLADLVWPFGLPPDAGGQTLADLAPEDHLIVSPRTGLFLTPSFGTAAKVSVLFQEPRAVHGRHMRMLRLFHRRFHRILTGDSHLLASLPNAILFPTGGSWVPGWEALDLTKRAMCSLIASKKARLPGHRLRHDMVRWCRETGQDVAIMGGGYRPFVEKSEGLAPYRYSLVIENVREPNYFSEKLIDAILCRTVPIYWGCPNIADFFDTRGMIICSSPEEMRAAVGRMSEADYAARRPALEALRPAAAGYADTYVRAARALVGGGAPGDARALRRA